MACVAITFYEEGSLGPGVRPRGARGVWGPGLSGPGPEGYSQACTMFEVGAAAV